MAEAPTSKPVSTRLQQIANQAREAPDMVFTNLAHHIDLDLLREAYRQTRKTGAKGVDGQNGKAYGEQLDENLPNLLDRMRTGRYFAPPVRRVYIPKSAKKDDLRPIGIPTFEDKVAQRAVATILNAVYEQDFYDCSYGFRPGRSPHQALEALREGLRQQWGGWVLEVDIRGFFDTLDHRCLRSFLDLRVRDRGIRRLIDKWLKAGIMEDGALRQAPDGTPQGGVVSPILANIYLHEVLDKWFHQEVRPRLRGRAFLIRYADDFIIGFRSPEDAKRVQEVMVKRFRKYGLEIHSKKTRLVDFRKPTEQTEPTVKGAFDFLGFTHHWGKSRKGNLVIRQRTAKTRLARALSKIDLWCKENRHKKLALQHATLMKKLNGHYQYYGLTGNSRALQRFRALVIRAWKKWLGRRSRKANMDWRKMSLLLMRYPLNGIKVVHSIYRAANPTV